MPHLIEIDLDLGAGQLPDGHARYRDMRKQYLAIARDRNAGMQFMAAACKRAQLLGSLRPAGRLGEKPRSQRQRLIRTGHEAVRPSRRHPQCFLACQQYRDIARG